ncbi:MAG: flagellar protein FlaG [Nitrosomonas sp.]|nr:MAG: flagellar protein FlaG [Nitrosomonas sp.]
MTINQINTIGALPLSSPPLSTSRKLSISNADVVASPVSTAGPKVNNSPKSEDQVKQAVQKIQGTVDNLAHNLRFSIDEDTGKTIIKVMDVHTEEVIRQIPSEEAVEIARTLDKVQGLLFNGKA